MQKERVAQVWPDWEIQELLGKGSYGTVYKAVRRDHHIQSCAAIKVITIPADRSEVDSLCSEGLSMDGAKTYFRGIVDDFVGEIRLMESLKGVQNIVSVEDYKVVERTEELGWDIYIRMELLTPFNTYIRTKQLTEEEVLRLGVDICTALELCGRRNVVHRDIKPENIFINDFGYFKLGDFGIARKLENVTGGLSQKGTYNYMAPEVMNGTRYDARVDLYSLGIVLYRLLNDNRLPFIETEQQLLSPNARKAAVERRLRGDRMQPPCRASAQMAAVIMRACAYDPEARFPNATAMKEALIRVGSGACAETEKLNKTAVIRSAAQPRTAVGSAGSAPVQRTPAASARQPVMPNNADRSTPPVRPQVTTNNINRSTPPVAPVRPPVAPNSVNHSTPPVAPVRPPVVPNNINRSTPPTYGSGYAKAQPQEPQGFSAMSLVSFILSLVAMFLALLCSLLSDPDLIFGFAWFEIVFCLAPMILSVLGARSATRQNQRGRGFSLAALILSLLFGCLAVDKMYVAMEDLGMIGRGMDLILSTITCCIVVALYVILYIMARKKKK